MQKRLMLFADPHFGLKRSSGTTPESMAAFCEWQLKIFIDLLKGADCPVVILGDLFDTAIVPYPVLINVMDALSFCNQKVYVLKGNHDQIKDRSQMSSLHFLEKVGQHNFYLIDEPVEMDGFAFIPHMSGQEAFDNAIAWAASESDTLITHANYDNPFSMDSDHSLDIMPEQAKMFERVIIGHEHNKSQRDNVIAIGSMVPCQVAEAEPKRYFILHEDGKLEEHEIPCSLPGAMDWTDLSTAMDDPECITDFEFIRVKGEASADEAPLVLKEVEAFRKRSKAFMIQNAVKVGKIDLGDLQETTAADLEKFDAAAELIALLSEGDVSELKRMGVV